MNAPPRIVGTGARTPLGLTAAAAAAALRAGLSAVGRHPYLVDRAGDMLPASVDALLDPLVTGPTRLWALLEPALRQACRVWESTPEGLPDRVTLVLAVPQRSTASGLDGTIEALRSALRRMTAFPVRIDEVEFVPGGHAAGIVALARAAARLHPRSAAACLVAGVDSHFDADTIERLDSARRLVGTVSRAGFVPAEGAACCLLLTDDLCERCGLTGLRLANVAVGREAVRFDTGEPCFGEGLTQAVGQAIGSGAAEPVDHVICDLNGERFRGEEWGFVSLRLGNRFADPMAYLAPADGWGDMGAASVPLFAMLADAARRRGQARGPRTLIWAASDDGLRGAALLEADTEARAAGRP